ncbi:neuronal pentraxin receptor-like protein [Lates japonicus]|uniref:Neuronal pentraxin receptor-like protein n=1 Tax=Lates japonicus TaxID=270547 RepID=A0AAD3RLW7_LATJO|nr:neuronal pentraxin receptor-like protein [Lates japonicus]
MKFVVVLVGWAPLPPRCCHLHHRQCLSRKRAAPLSDNGTLTSRRCSRLWSPSVTLVRYAPRRRVLRRREWARRIDWKFYSERAQPLGEETGGGGSAKQFSFSRLDLHTCTGREDCKTKDPGSAGSSSSSSSRRMNRRI